MARVSKKKLQITKGQSENVYSVGIYARLSVDSGDRTLSVAVSQAKPAVCRRYKNESIETQVEIAKEFIRQQSDMKIYDIYTDLGRTGINFARESFERMMCDVKMRKINCIVVKDLSRFGRNHIETGNYIENIFPFMGVRFIAVADNFDSMYLPGRSVSMDVNLKNLVNEMYVRDIAVKVKAGKKAKWEQGSYTGGIPPYGYRAEWVGDKKCLLIEKDSADIVKKIFDLFLLGNSIRKIVVWLYENKVVRPTEYHKTGQVYCGIEGELLQWPRATVKMLLTNPVYMGCLVQKGISGKDYMMRDKCDMNSEDWKVKEHTHEAIISEELFFKAVRKFGKATTQCDKNELSKELFLEKDLFAGLLYCGDCGARMKRTTSGRKYSSKGSPKDNLKDSERSYSYNCPKAGRIDQMQCAGKSITLRALTEIVEKIIWQEMILSGMQPEDILKIVGREMEALKEEQNGQIAMINRKLKRIRQLGCEQYFWYKEGKMAKEEFKRAKEENDRKAASLQKESNDISEKLRGIEDRFSSGNFFLDILMGDQTKDSGKGELTLEVVRALIDRIEVYPEHRVKVIVSYKHRKDFDSREQ